MSDVIGYGVLERKTKTSYDKGTRLGQTVLMANTPLTVIERGIIQRTREAREESGLTQDEIAKALGIEQGTYKNYETIRVLPPRYVPQFCAECRVMPNDLYPVVKRLKQTG